MNQSACLVVGGTGNIGRGILKLVLSTNNKNWTKVYAIARQPLEQFLEKAGCGKDTVTRTQLDLSRLEIVPVDASDSANVNKICQSFKWATPVKAVFFASSESSQQVSNSARLALSSYGSISDPGTEKRFKEGCDMVALASYTIYGGVVSHQQGRYEEDVLLERQHSSVYGALNNLGVRWASVIFAGTIGPIQDSHHYCHTGPTHVYASVCRALKKPLIYPGPSSTLKIKFQQTPVDLYAEMYEFLVLQKKTKIGGNCFNCVTTTYTWKEAWKQLAQAFGMQPDFPCERGERFNAEAFVDSKEFADAWRALHKKHNLLCSSDVRTVNWSFFFMLFNWSEEFNFEMRKISDQGFPKERLSEAQNSWIASNERFFKELEANRLVPPRS